MLFQAVGLVLLLQLAVAGVVTRGAPVLGSVSLWPVLIALVYGWVLYLTYTHVGQPRWTASNRDDVPEELRDEATDAERAPSPSSPRATYVMFALLSLLVLAAGFLATESADALAERWDMSDAFVGATLLAFATSLPEVSTTFAAARSERYSVAFSNIFGSNCFDVALLLLAELLNAKGSIFVDVEPNVAFVPLIGSVMTCAYLWGMMERRNGTLLGIGRDSAVALLAYFAGMTLLYFMS